MVPEFSSYKISPKHRVPNKPSKIVSVWTVSKWDEVQLFVTAYAKNWWYEDDQILWAIMVKDSKMSKIGEDLNNDLYIAKYRCDSNLEWHGYPVHPKEVQDIPPHKVLKEWYDNNLISKRDKCKIQKGQFFV